MHEDNEISLQEMFDGMMSLTPAQACLVLDMQDIHRRHYDTIFNHGYTEAVMEEWDKVASRYELSRAHRKADPVKMQTVGGREVTIH